MRRLCNWIARRFPARVIYDRGGTRPYLTRVYLLGGPRDPEHAFDERGVPKPGVEWSKLPFNLYLHRFHQGDDDEALHNHPWKWSLSLILAGGYSEERRCREGCGMCHDTGVYHVARREVRPGHLNFIRANDFHRVDLLEDDAWSLFLAGPKTQTWGFWDRVTGAYTHWIDFIRARRARTGRT